MEKDRSSKVVAIAALIVAVVGLGIGFAAFSSTLTINSSATVNPTNTFKVQFSKESSALTKGTVSGVVAGEGAVAADATISDADDYLIADGLAATFTAPGQTVSYTFYARNTGEYIAYLRSITFDGTKACAVKTEGVAADAQATDSLVQAADRKSVV